MSQAVDLGLYAVLDLGVVPSDRAPELALAAARGGAGAIQVRGKQLDGADLLSVVDRVREALRSETSVVVLVNDRVDAAVLAGADGVHVGDDDLDVEACRVLMPEAMIGRTVRGVAAARAAEADGAHYLGAGSIYASTTKRGVQVIGLEGLERIVDAVDCPVVAIGGIDADSAGPCIEHGASGVAVVGALFGDDGGQPPGTGVVERRAATLRRTIERARGQRTS